MTTHTYHPTRQTLASVRARFNTTDFHHMSFQFDGLGNLTRRQDHRHNRFETFRYAEPAKSRRIPRLRKEGTGRSPSGNNLNRLRRSALNASAQGGTDEITYDSLGRITFKEGVGSYNYASGSRRYRLDSAGTEITGSVYDANGNLTRQERFGHRLTVRWTSFNQPATMYHGPTSGPLRNGSLFRYDAGGHRTTHIVVEDDTQVRKTLYIGGFEQSRVKNAQGQWTTDYTRIAIGSPTGVVGTYDHKAAATSAAQNTRSYYHYDHLGTLVAVTGSWMTNNLSAYLNPANHIQRYAYDAWGKERSPTTWAGNPPGELGHVDVHRGFTGHEMLRHLGLVHMNGRIYDPHTGRFLSPDPFVQAPGNLQNYNRYGYVLNNPLSYTDPSGYFFKKLFRSVARFVKQYWQVIVAVGLAALTGYGMMLLLKGTALSSATIGAIAGAAAGFVGSFAGSILHGGSLSQAFSAGLTGALWGAVGGAAAGQIGSWAEGWKGAVEFKRAMAHGISGGTIGQVRDGNFLSGFFAGAASSFVSHAEFSSDWGDVRHTIAAAVIGGTASKIGGGSFENGAVTGAFQDMFNRRLSAEKRRSREAAQGIDPDRFEKITGMTLEESVVKFNERYNGSLTVGDVQKIFADSGFAKDFLLNNENVHKYYRDMLNQEVPLTLDEASKSGFTEMKWPGNIYHNPEGNRMPWNGINRKFVGPYGFREAVYGPDGNLLTASTNRAMIGTFNFHPGGVTTFHAHRNADIVPFKRWGN